jgi:hypothetical protein
MHRSGTSVLTRGLKALGVYLGETFLDPEPDNPTGYWELKEILGLNERVMEAIGSPWWSSRQINEDIWESDVLDQQKKRAASLLAEVFRGRPLWGFKDPRTIRLFPFWRDVLRGLGPSVSIVLAIRPPLSAARSLVARPGGPLDDPEALWLAYMLPRLPEIAKYPVVVVDYDRLIDKPLVQLRRIASHLGVSLDPAEPEITEYTHSFVDVSLRHHVLPRSRTRRGDATSSLAEQAYSALLPLAKRSNEQIRQASWRRVYELARRYRAEASAQREGKRSAA